MSDFLVKGLEAMHIDHVTFGDLLDLVGAHLQFYTIFCMGRPCTTVKDVLHFTLLVIHRGQTNDIGKDLMNILTSVLKEESLYRVRSFNGFPESISYTIPFSHPVSKDSHAV